MPSLVALAEELLAQAKAIEDILHKNNIPSTSFDEDTLEALPEDAQKLRMDLGDNSHNFDRLVRGAHKAGIDLAMGWIDTVVLRVIWKYKLASAIPMNGSATYEEISQSSGLSKSITFRTIRTAMTMNIFDESAPGHVCHTAISKLLATNEGYFSFVGMSVEDLGPSSTKLIEAWERFGDEAAEPDQSAFSLYNGGRSLFTVLAQDPGYNQRFNLAMKYSLEDKSFSWFDISNAFDWSTLDTPGSTLIDLGGGLGQNCHTLAMQTHNLAFVVQDLPHVVKNGRSILPSEFKERIVFEVHNFFEPQEPRENLLKTYLISRCLHNWSDHKCVQIFRQLIPTLQKGSRILIVEWLISDEAVKKLSEKFILQMDLSMATLMNGKDRSANEFRQLLKMSDERFVLENIRKPEGSKFSMLEVLWTG